MRPDQEGVPGGSPRLLFAHIAQLATPAGGDGPQRGRRQGEVTLMPDAYLLVENGRIRTLGPMASLPAGLAGAAGAAGQAPGLADAAGLAGAAGEGGDAGHPGVRVVDCSGCTVTPGLVDPHTHAVFGGWRADEFSRRLAGERYEDILAAGGGILETVRATRATGEEELVQRSRAFLDAMLAGGTTTVEVKSGYGLDLETELRQLRVAARLAAEHPAGVVATYLGAHAVPREYRDNPDAYVDFVVEEVLPTVAWEGLARYCDVFCEQGVFDLAQSRRILTAAHKLGMGLRLHADEIVPLGGAALAAELKAASADHLLQADDRGLAAMAEAGCVAVLLPGTAFFLRKPCARARDMIDRFDLPVALATDFNPGSCPLHDLRLVMTLACLNMHLTPAEALVAATFNAAHVLGLADRTGSLGVGRDADLVVWDCPDYRHLTYRVGAPLVRAVYRRGRRVAP